MLIRPLIVATIAIAVAQGGANLVTLSVVGTSDLHGAAFTRNGAGGLPLLAGYVNNLRRVRAADEGGVLLIDSGDTFQGEAESNLSEGAFIVDAYNAMGFAAKAIGNHDFDFGSVDAPDAHQTPGDLQGAVKARAAQAHFPFLAANLVDDQTARPVAWPNVRPSVLVKSAGVNVGIIGVITIDALRSTIAANVQGLRVAPLVPAITAEAQRLRAEGADVVIVAAHAGGRCDRFDDPADLSSCDGESEIFRVARALPSGLVDLIAAGHTHNGIAHVVNGIGIIQPYSKGQTFDRADIVFDRQVKRVVAVHVFAPRQVCASNSPSSGACASVPPAARATYEGRPVVPDAAVARAMQPGLERVQRLEASSLGVSLDTAIPRGSAFGSPLGNVFADAIRDAVPGADAAILNNATRGLWADLSAGRLTFGALYRLFPFDNRIARVTLTAADLGQWLRTEIAQGRGSALGISGIDVRSVCAAGGQAIVLARGAAALRDDDRLVVATIGGPTLSGSIATRDPLGGGPPENSPVVREAVERWLRQPAALLRERVQSALASRLEQEPPLATCAF
jgi:5'-nucleotidase